MGAASSRLQEVSMQEPVNKEERKALALLDGISGGEGIEAIVSFPGLFQEEWNEIVAMADLMKRLDPDNAFFSTACIFLPDGDPNFGQHYANDIDNDGKCFCHKLYGEKKAWGCKWFHIWRNQFLEILRRGQTPVVVYKAGQVGQGDDANWADFPIPFSTNRPGLGGSQAGEVALVKVYVGERFIKRDVKDVSEAGVQALAKQLPKLLALEELGLSNNNIGEAAAQALAKQLPKLLALKGLDLSNNNIGEAGAQALAKQLPKLLALKGLGLSNNNIGEAGGRAVAEQLPKLPALVVLDLRANNLGEAGAQALAEQLPKLLALEQLYLGINNIGEAGEALLKRAKPRQLELVWD